MGSLSLPCRERICHPPPAHFSDQCQSIVWLVVRHDGPKGQTFICFLLGSASLLLLFTPLLTLESLQFPPRHCHGNGARYIRGSSKVHQHLRLHGNIQESRVQERRNATE